MLKRFWRWIKNHPVKLFFLILFFPVYGLVIYLIIVFSLYRLSDWYYEEFPFSTLAVRLFAEPGEDTLMFRYRLGDRLLYVRSDVAMPARYSGREKAICNPLWGECRVFPLEVPIYKEPETGKICINRYPDCSSILDVPYAYRAEFVIYPQVMQIMMENWRFALVTKTIIFLPLEDIEIIMLAESMVIHKQFVP